MFLVIKITIDNVISKIKRYKLIILCIKQAIIDLNVFIYKFWAINKCKVSMIHCFRIVTNLLQSLACSNNLPLQIFYKTLLI